MSPKVSGGTYLPPSKALKICVGDKAKLERSMGGYMCDIVANCMGV